MDDDDDNDVVLVVIDDDYDLNLVNDKLFFFGSIFCLS